MGFITILTIASICVAGAGGYYYYKRKNRPNGFGFRDMLKNPGNWNAFGAAVREAERLSIKAQYWDDEEVSDAIHYYVFEIPSSREGWQVEGALKSIGPRIIPFLLAILSNEKNRAKLVKVTGKDIIDEAPFNRVCELFDDTPPAEAAPLIAPFLYQEQKEIRKDAALILGKIATDETIPHIRKALMDEDEYVRSYAVMGLEFAASSDRIDGVVASELFDDLKATLSEFNCTRHAAAVMLGTNRQRAIDVFLSTDIFNAEFKMLSDILRILAKEHIPVSRPTIIALIRELETKEPDYPYHYTLEAALHLLGRHQDPQDEVLLHRLASHGNQNIANGATKGLLALHGMDDFLQVLCDKQQKQGWEALTQPQKNYLEVCHVDGEVYNGGFAQYFMNPGGQRWKLALTALQQMGFKERTAIFQEALAVFGPTRLPEDTEERRELLARIMKQNDNAFSDIESKWYKCTEHVHVKAAEYVLANPDAFQ